MAAPLHRGLQNSQLNRRISSVPPGCQRSLCSAPITGVTSLPGHRNILSGELCGNCRVSHWRFYSSLFNSRSRCLPTRGQGNGRRPVARHGLQCFQHFVVAYRLNRGGGQGTDLRRNQQAGERQCSVNLGHVN